MGYSGVATFVRSPHAIPTSVEAGLCGYATDAAGGCGQGVFLLVPALVCQLMA